MTNIVEFPGLGLEFEVSRIAFTLFGIPVFWYGICIGVGMLLAVLFAFWKAESFGIDADRMIDVIIIGFVGGIVGARLYYVLFVDFEYRTFLEMIDLRSGGLAIYGGVIGAFITVAIACKLRKVPFLPMIDLVSIGFLIGQALGRWGNFFNQEAFGANTDSLFRMISPATTAYLQNAQSGLAAAGVVVDPAMPVHPTFLYESVWCFVGFLFLWWYSSRRRFNGEMTLIYVMWYGLGRFFIEGLRTDSLMFMGVRVSQLFALASMAAALAIWIVVRKKTKGTPLRVPQIMPHTAIVTLQHEGVPTKVTIEWPAGKKAPSKAQQIAMAEQVLQETKQHLDSQTADEQPATDTAVQPADADAEPQGNNPEDTTSPQ